MLTTIIQLLILLYIFLLIFMILDLFINGFKNGGENLWLAIPFKQIKKDINNNYLDIYANN